MLCGPILKLSITLSFNLFCISEGWWGSGESTEGLEPWLTCCPAPAASPEWVLGLLLSYPRPEVAALLSGSERAQARGEPGMGAHPQVLVRVWTLPAPVPVLKSTQC